MQSKDILIASLTYFWSLVIFERDDFILDQCAPLGKLLMKLTIHTTVLSIQFISVSHGPLKWMQMYVCIGI